MPLTKEKRIRIAGVELAAGLDAKRANRISRSFWWRYLARPPLALANRLGKSKRSSNGSVQPQMRSNTWTIPGNGNSAASAVQEDSAEAKALRERISGRYWYHTLDLGHGVSTPGFVDNRPQVNLIGLPESLAGKRCMDIGTFDGFWAFEMERRGAEEVVAVDLDSLEQMDIRPLFREQFIAEAIKQRGTAKLGETFHLAKEIFGSKVERKICNLYELSPELAGKFDAVHCSDVIPHIRDPQLAIENIFSVTKGFAILGSAFDPELDELGQPLMRVCPTGGDFVWWWYSASSLKLMMELAGFQRVEEVNRIRVDNNAGKFWKVFLKGYAS